MKPTLASVALISLLACGVADSALTVTSPATLDSVTVLPAALSLFVSDTGRLTAHLLDSRGGMFAATGVWSSADPAIASVNKNDGTVIAHSAGTTVVTVTAQSFRATAIVSVRNLGPPVAISISTLAFGLITGGVERLTARVTDSSGHALPATLEWSSSDPAVATVDRSDGTVTAITPGSTQVTVAAGELRAIATVPVTSIAGSFAFTRSTKASDGTWIYDVLLFSAADRSVRSLNRTGQFASIASPTWSPDGTHLAFEMIQASVFDGENGDYVSDVYVMATAPPTDAPWRALTGDGLSKSPAWSPDGRTIAYSRQAKLFSRSHIYTIAPCLEAVGPGVAEEPCAAINTPVRLTTIEGWYGPSRWSPDGQRLAFVDWTDGHIAIVNADGTVATTGWRSTWRDWDPSWSPDGRRIAFVSSRESNEDYFRIDVFVAELAVGNVKRLASLPDYSSSPAWSPDGRQIMFSSGGALYVMNPDGTSLVRVLTPPQLSYDTGPAWKP